MHSSRRPDQRNTPDRCVSELKLKPEQFVGLGMNAGEETPRRGLAKQWLGSREILLDGWMDGGGAGNRTRVQGFAVPCLSHSATPPTEHAPYSPPVAD